MEKSSKKAILLIMDGWGLGAVPEADAIKAADTPFTDNLYNQYPNAKLDACGESVGLPEGQMGNSEVGHLNLGAGRIVYQELQRINVAIKNLTLKNNPLLKAAFANAKENNKKIHLIGLVSDGGVHSHTKHLQAICEYAEDFGVQQYFIHAFTDGRDTDPKSGYEFINELQFFLQEKRGKIASVTGRFYAMDRDKRWERVKIAYDALVHGKGKKTQNIPEAILESYKENITDEFILPIIATQEDGTPLAFIESRDIVICFNFRTDRCREITMALTQQDFEDFDMHKIPLQYYTMTEYDSSYKDVFVLFNSDNLNNTIGEVLSKNEKKQIRIAETEKYPHVTFFFSGGREELFEGEKRLICPSPKDVKTYDLKPEMSAFEITNTILPEIESQTADFICLNFANADMVGHTGVWEAAMKAAETVDQCVSKIVPVALANEYAVFLTADHGNSDYLINFDGSPNTAHSLNKVPLILISNDYHGLIKDGKLGDIAPSILSYMGLLIPPEMTGEVLLY